MVPVAMLLVNDAALKLRVGSAVKKIFNSVFSASFGVSEHFDILADISSQAFGCCLFRSCQCLWNLFSPVRRLAASALQSINLFSKNLGLLQELVNAMFSLEDYTLKSMVQLPPSRISFEAGRLADKWRSPVIIHPPPTWTCSAPQPSRMKQHAQSDCLFVTNLLGI